LQKKIATLESDDKEMIDNTFTSGLLHDVGKLLLFSHMHEEYEQAVIQALETPCSLHDAEQQVFGAGHCPCR
jgi:HD-like signal output (HDOD) protein